jgi:hypothetical protein
MVMEYRSLAMRIETVPRFDTRPNGSDSEFAFSGQIAGSRPGDGTKFPAMMTPISKLGASIHPG